MERAFKLMFASIGVFAGAGLSGGVVVFLGDTRTGSLITLAGVVISLVLVLASLRVYLKRGRHELKLRSDR